MHRTKSVLGLLLGKAFFVGVYVNVLCVIHVDPTYPHVHALVINTHSESQINWRHGDIVF